MIIHMITMTLWRSFERLY